MGGRFRHRAILGSFPLLVAAVTALSAGLSAGCGGGGGGGGTSPTPTPTPVSTPTPTPSPTPTPTPTPTPAPRRAVPQFAIQWAARSRATGAVSSSVSAVVTLQGAADDGSDVHFIANRDTTKPAAYTQSYVFPASVREGSYPMIVVCYGQPNGVLPIVAYPYATATLGDTGALPDVSLTQIIKHVTVATGQSVPVGKTADLTVTASDGANAIVPVTPGSIFLNITTGGANLANGNGGATVQGLHPGTAGVTGTIDGVVSAAALVTVTSNTVVAIAPNLVPTLFLNGTIKFAATVTNAPDTSVTWSVQEGSAGGTIDVNGNYTAPNTAGTYHVVATSNYDPTHKDSVAVTVAYGGVTVGGNFPGSGGVSATVN